MGGTLKLRLTILNLLGAEAEIVGAGLGGDRQALRLGRCNHRNGVGGREVNDVNRTACFSTELNQQLNGGHFLTAEGGI